MYHIYQVTNNINGKVYVGFTTKSPSVRWKEHQEKAFRGDNNHFSNAIRKYGSGNFTPNAIEEGLDQNFGKNFREPYWISLLKPEYNMTKGGEGCLGYHHTENHKLHMSKVQQGHTISEETRQRMSQSQKIRKHPPHTEETKIRMSRSQRGHLCTEETRLRISNTKRKQGPVTCPKCLRIGNGSIMRRWHFDNCKQIGVTLCG
jgi:group I intron endonuclease